MNYHDFVNNEKLSNCAKNNQDLSDRLLELDVKSICNYSRLLNGAIGAASEAAELLEVLTYPSNKDAAIDELGDVLFYLAVSAEAIVIDHNATEITSTNIYNIESFFIKEEINKLVVYTGKYLDIVKKIVFQGKDYADNKIKLHQGYNLTYNAVLRCCAALDVTVEQVQQKNMDKLNGRYKNGFTVNESEKKK